MCPIHTRYLFCYFQWNTPDVIIYKCATGQIVCGTPQKYETLRMCHFRSVEELCQFSHQRAVHGIPRCLVVIVLCADGVVALYPGTDITFLNVMW